MWLDAAREAVRRDPSRLTDLLLGRSPVDVARLHRAEPWLRERVRERLQPPERDEVLAVLDYDLPLATCLRLARARDPDDARAVLARVPRWVLEELEWLRRCAPDSREARLLHGASRHADPSWPATVRAPHASSRSSS